MSVADDLEQFLTAMSLEEFVEFAGRTRLGKPTHATNRGAIQKWKDRRIKGAVASKYNNLPFFEQLCKAANIVTDEERALRSQEVGAHAAERANALAGEANALAAEANEFADTANTLSENASRQAGRALRIAWIAAIAAVVSAVVAVVSLLVALQE